jgi:hypothetical protein
MTLKALKFRPGVNRENTTLANEGTWFESDKVRFKSGNPQKIGGWERDSGVQASGLQPPTGRSYWGVARAMWNWANLTGSNLLAVGTNLKYYIQNTVGGAFNDVTPLRETTGAGDATFTATDGSNSIVVDDAGSNTQAGDFVTFSGAVSLGGAITADILNTEHRVATVNSSAQYTIVVGVNANASDTGDGGASTIARYQLTTGSDIFTVGVGWGAGGWGGITAGAPSTGWGVAAPAGLGLGIQLRTWSQSNWGEDLIFNPRGGALYYWKNNANPSLFDRGVVLSPASPSPFTSDAYCPTVCNFVQVTDQSRFAVAYGVNDPDATNPNQQDPMLIRWSAQNDYTIWDPLDGATTQAGFFRLTRGSEIICAQQTRQEVLVFTDAAVYSQQYQGLPFVFNFQLLADNTSIAGPNAVVTVHDVTYWMGVDKFYVYNGRVQTLPSDLRTFVFQDINLSQQFQITAGINDAFSEVWWFYCSANSTTVDRYVVYNYLENIWYYGNMARTAWLDAPLRDVPVAAGYGGQILYHETGNDDGSVNPPVAIENFIQSADFNLDDGDEFGYVWRIVPDITFDGSNAPFPTANFTLRPRQFPGTNYGISNNPAVQSANNYLGQRTYNVQQFTPQVNVRLRGRQMALRVGSDTTGVAWQLGTPTADIKPSGRR